MPSFQTPAPLFSSRYRSTRARTRQLVLLSSGVFLLASCGQSNPGDVPDPVTPTGPVSPSNPTTNVGPAGGTITSTDGALSLNFPAGAVSAPVNVVIKSVANSAPNSFGPAFELEPAGLALAQPVTATLRVDGALIGDALPQELGVAKLDANGQWLVDLSSRVSTSGTALSNPTTNNDRAAIAANAVTISVTVSIRSLQPTTIVTMWQVEPKKATVATGGVVPIRILACYRDTALDDDVQMVAALPICAPSTRTGTWSVSGIVGGTEEYGKVNVLSPTSTARYQAPLQPPIPNKVEVVASMYWPQRGVTQTFAIPVTVTGSPEWTGVITYTKSGSKTSIEQVTGKRTTETVEGSGTFNLRALPSQMTQTGGIIKAAGIVATDKYSRVEHQQGLPDRVGCVAIIDYTENLVGSSAIIPAAQDYSGSAFITFSGNSYRLNISGIFVEISGLSTGTYTTRCPTFPDDVRTVSTNLTSDGGLDPSGQEWTRDIDTANPGRLTGSATFSPSGLPWQTVKVTWDLRRPN